MKGLCDYCDANTFNGILVHEHGCDAPAPAPEHTPGSYNIWVVTSGMPGYMPATVHYARTKADAINTIRWERDDFMEAWPDHVKSGVTREGYLHFEATTGGPDWIIETEKQQITPDDFSIPAEIWNEGIDATLEHIWDNIWY